MCVLLAGNVNRRVLTGRKRSIEAPRKPLLGARQVFFTATRRHSEGLSGDQRLTEMLRRVPTGTARSGEDAPRAPAQTGALVSALRRPRCEGPEMRAVCARQHRRNEQDTKATARLETRRAQGHRAAPPGRETPAACVPTQVAKARGERRLGELWKALGMRTPACCFPAPPARPT